MNAIYFMATSFEKTFISSIEMLGSCSKYNNKACSILGTDGWYSK